MYATHIETISHTSPDQWHVVMQLYQQLPEFDNRHQLSDLSNTLQHKSHLLQLGYIAGELAGFKLGYALNDQIFYSWLGGVLPDYRNLGLAKHMLQQQEQWAKTQGYQVMQVKSSNRFRAMLTMLISRGYHITALAEHSNIADHQLTLQKPL
ncbi:N-acetyltransferase GCN5 [Shewanella sp. NFH-SH190041]|uniref:GNAT family N-acetyltransferase n=1 Tax=Shewanella sp. NFH-SH190041 TaxID=2950245 RepID=UPI0021C4673E|nr:GNAT family N-acetyltransferase [Shewanella sp. NFH-SH190041]BDM62793.1 N-acetyltransferase GCN5 [Shewanella sp. NFH-SH190041]